jgi:hypothetical protein
MAVLPEPGLPDTTTPLKIGPEYGTLQERTNTENSKQKFPEYQPKKRRYDICQANAVKRQQREQNNTLQRKSHLCNPFLEIARPQSPLPHSCDCERFIYSHDRSAYSAAEICAARYHQALKIGPVYTARKNQYRKFETNIPREGIARPQSQFPHSCICERFIYCHDRSAYSAAWNTRNVECECGNWD